MAEFDVHGQWDAIQDNNFTAVFNILLQRPDGAIIGTGSHSNGTVVGAGFGSVHDGQFIFQITWNNNTEGLYSGVLDGQRLLRGSAFDVRNPTSVTGWHSSRAF